MVRNQKFEFQTLTCNSMLLNEIAKTSHSGKMPQTQDALRLATWVMTTAGVHLNRIYVTTDDTVDFFHIALKENSNTRSNNHISTPVYQHCYTNFMKEA